MFTLSQFPLPYAQDALAPYISASTMHYHHDMHVGTYIKNLNDLITGTRYEGMPLIDIIKESTKSNDDKDKKIFNNAAQVFNHDFFFHNMRPNGGGVVPVKIADAFGGAEKFKSEFKKAAAGLFGSGWTWLVRDGDEIKIMTTANADTPVAHGLQPIMTLDVWEHAYYLDYQNRRAEFIDAYLEHLVDWDSIQEALK